MGINTRNFIITYEQQIMNVEELLRESRQLIEEMRENRRRIEELQRRERENYEQSRSQIFEQNGR
jgi:hypothetical protein